MPSADPPSQVPPSQAKSSIEVNTEASATVKEAQQAEAEEELHLPVDLHQIKLISVALKEAALDSPSFRASVAHLHNQLMTTEKWILALRSSLTKIPKQVKELQSYVDSFLEYMTPQSLSDGLVDQEYTQTAMNAIFDGLRMIWDISLGLLNFSIPRLETTKDHIIERIALYQTYKMRYDVAQANYDKFLQTHMATSKSKDPALIMEDSLQLFNVRKEYLNASLDLILEVNQVIDQVNNRRSALIAYSFAGSTVVPTALSANIWGSLNWGVYYLHDDTIDRGAKEPEFSPEDIFTKQIGQGIMVPSNYPDTLLASEIQLRALFEAEVDGDECCLLSFHCLWSPNSNQELRSTAFITHKHFYFYLHSSGFVSLCKIPIDQIVEASCVLKKTYDYVKVFRVNGSMKLKIFLDEGILIAQKINGIVENCTSNNPLDVCGLINKLKDIERDYESKKEELMHMAQNKASTNEASSFQIDRNPHDPTPRFRVDFSDDMYHLCQYTIKLPPKAVFHILFGAKSHVLDASYPVISVKYITKGSWMKVPGNDRGLYRDFLSALVYHNGKTDTVTVRQEIEDMSDNEYYCCKASRSMFKFGMVTFEIKSRITFQLSFANGIYRRLEKTSSVIGSHGQIAKAIYLYGKIPVAETPYVVPKPNPTKLNIDTLFRLMARGTAGSIWRKAKEFVYFVIRTTQAFFSSLSMHMFLVSVIFVLGLMNVFFMGRSTVTYWQAKNAKGLMLDVIHNEPMVMERAIYLKEVQELIKKQHVTGDNSTCFQIFQNQSFVANYDQASAWKLRYEDDIARTVATNLRKTLREIGIRRNELIVSLQMLNQLEEEVAKGEWHNWLSDELEKCSYLTNPPNDEQEVSKEIKSMYADGVDQLLAFCDCCSQEMAQIKQEE
ncbi:hypothetical protein CJJ09_005242 [Candidozyma auris]|nr:hypothetical protein CJJ09_005242 [[Candida] auris]